jgi:hypothetical protein
MKVGQPSRLTTGTDEHGNKVKDSGFAPLKFQVVNAARQLGLDTDVQRHCDLVSTDFRVSMIL